MGKHNHDYRKKTKITNVDHLILGSTSMFPQTENQKPRIIVLTDIENEPDDAMSLARFLT